MLQGQNDLKSVTKLILSELAPVVSAQHGVFYMMDQADDEQVISDNYISRRRQLHFPS